MTFAQPFTFICDDCDTECRNTVAALPHGWTRKGDRVICASCSPVERPPVASYAPARVSDRCETAIPLLSGARLDLADPDCSVIALIDIAAGLRQPRFTAQTRDFYTIAQHSLLVLRLVGPIARKIGGQKGLQLRRCALMHDAAEAFIHDITTPLKRQLADYRAIEARLETRLQRRFGFEFTPYRRDAVKLADLQALAIEQRDLLGREDPWPILDRIDRDQLRSVKITRVWSVDEAQGRFLEAFEDLFPTTERNAA